LSIATVDSGPTRKVSVLLAVGIIVVPLVFVWFLLRKGHSTLSRVLGFTWLFAMLLLMAGKKEDNLAPSSPSVAQVAVEPTSSPAPAPHRAKIAEGAIYDIDRSTAPKAYKAWGSEWVKKINAMQPKAAALIAQTEECQVLDTLGLSEDKSTVRKDPVFFANCSEDVRVYISMKEIEAGAVPVSENAKLAAVDDSDLQALCSNYTKSLMKYPSTYDEKIFSSGVRRMGWGRARVEIAYEAKNDFGGKLPGKAICSVEGSSISMPELANR